MSDTESPVPSAQDFAPPVEGTMVGGRTPERRNWIGAAAIALGVAAILTLVWGLGGFERRTDLLTPTPAGTLVTVGPYEFTFTEATAQRTIGFDKSISWTLTAVGTGRTTGNESIAPSYGDDGTFASKDTRSGEVETPTGVRYGPGKSFTDGAQFTPGLPPEGILVDFTYKASYVPGATLRFLVVQLEFADHSLIGDQPPTWNTTNHAFDLQLPVRVLPQVRQ